ncbi:hypothetical protein MRX96_009949 [Rhipicephalus microplus]
MIKTGVQHSRLSGHTTASTVDVVLTRQTFGERFSIGNASIAMWMSGSTKEYIRDLKADASDLRHAYTRTSGRRDVTARSIRSRCRASRLVVRPHCAQRCVARVTKTCIS